MKELYPAIHHLILQKGKAIAGEGTSHVPAEDENSSWHQFPVLLQAGIYSHSDQLEKRRSKSTRGQSARLRAGDPGGNKASHAPTLPELAVCLGDAGEQTGNCSGAQCQEGRSRASRDPKT